MAIKKFKFKLDITANTANSVNGCCVIWARVVGSGIKDGATPWVVEVNDFSTVQTVVVTPYYTNETFISCSDMKIEVVITPKCSLNICDDTDGCGVEFKTCLEGVPPQINDLSYHYYIDITEDDVFKGAMSETTGGNRICKRFTLDLQTMLSGILPSTPTVGDSFYITFTPDLLGCCPVGADDLCNPSPLLGNEIQILVAYYDGTSWIFPYSETLSFCSSFKLPVGANYSSYILLIDDNFVTYNYLNQSVTETYCFDLANCCYAVNRYYLKANSLGNIINEDKIYYQDISGKILLNHFEPIVDINGTILYYEAYVDAVEGTIFVCNRYQTDIVKLFKVR